MANDPNDNTEVGTGSGSGAGAGGIESIIDKIIADEGGGQQDGGQQNDGQQDGGARTPPQKAPASRATAAGQGQGQGSRTPAQTPQRTPLQGFGPGLYVDADGNVTNLQGQPIARAGDERRLLERARGPVNNLVRQYSDLQSKLELLEKAHGISKDNGLTPADIMVGHQLAAAWKKDKKATLTHLLTLAKEEGITIEGVGGANAIDVPAIAAAVQKAFEDKINKFVPLLDWWTSENEQRLAKQKSDEEVDQFLTDYPDAIAQEGAIASVMRKSNGQLSMHQAYTMLLRFAAEKGLDWNKPLEDQLNGNQGARGTTGQNRSRVATSDNQSDLPPFGGQGDGGRVVVKPGGSNESWDSLIRGTLQEVARK